MQAGNGFDLEDDVKILAIKSPKIRVTGGPYKVIWKDIKEKWAIIAFEWDNENALGIRWFHGNAGHPSRGKNSLWMVLPSNLSQAVLNGLPLRSDFRDRINDFLAKKISGEDL